MNKYQFLLFDADDTLLDFSKDMSQAFRLTYRHHFEAQQPYKPEFLKVYDNCNTKWWKKFERRECTKQELYVNRFVDFLAETGLTGNPAQINQSYFENLGAGGALFPGALELIQNLSKAFSVYIITNGNAATQKTRLEHSGLTAYIKDCFVSEEAGAAKPDSKYFNYAFSKISNFQKEKAIVIGDSLTSDILGAKNAGLPCLWYNPSHLPNPEGLPFLLEVETYRQIQEFFYGDL